jgi:hypothetical protein
MWVGTFETLALGVLLFENILGDITDSEITFFSSFLQQQLHALELPSMLGGM